MAGAGARARHTSMRQKSLDKTFVLQGYMCNLCHRQTRTTTWKMIFMGIALQTMSSLTENVQLSDSKFIA